MPFLAVDLWTQFQQELCADYRLDHNLTQSTNLALEDIARYLSSQGSTLSQCGLPEPQHHDSEVDLELSFFCDRLPTLRRRSEAAYTRMNADQQRIFDDILRHCGSGGCFFIDGRTGRGKTFLIYTIYDHLRVNGDIVYITGTTVISITYYDRGRTAYLAFGIPIQESDLGLQSKISIHLGRAELLRQAAIII